MRNGISRVAKRHIAVVVMACCSLAASAQGEAIDDVMQHVPMATTYLLRTCGVKSQSDTWVEFMASTGATFAFAGATALRHEYGHLSPWVTIGGYGLATLVAADRVRRDRHYTHDVCAGAAIGWLSTELTYYIKKKYIKSDRVDVAFTGQSLSLAIRW